MERIEEISGKNGWYLWRNFFHHFNFLNITKFAQLAGINPSLMRQYKQGQYVSEKQVSKIQTEIHRIGRELMSINLF